MHIVVCIKQVPDTTDVKINPETNTLVREGVASIINPFDMYAIEEAIRVKERMGAGKVTVVSMGPPQVEEALRDLSSEKVQKDGVYFLASAVVRRANAVQWVHRRLTAPIRERLAYEQKRDRIRRLKAKLLRASDKYPNLCHFAVHAGIRNRNDIRFVNIAGNAFPVNPPDSSGADNTDFECLHAFPLMPRWTDVLSASPKTLNFWAISPDFP